MSEKMKRGRPADGADAATVKVIHVGLDEETLAVLERLETALGTGVGRGRRSIVVRRALLAAGKALK